MMFFQRQLLQNCFNKMSTTDPNKKTLSFGEKIRALRAQANWTQPELANKLKIEQSYLSKIENDHHRPSEELLYRLAELFKLSPTELLRGIDTEIIRTDFRHIPKIIEELQAIDTAKTRHTRQWLISCLCLIFLGMLLVITGYFNVIAPEKVYNYSYDTLYITNNPDFDNFFTYDYLGPSTFKIVNNKKKSYRLEENSIKEIPRWINQFFIFIGLLSLSIGVIGLVFDQRIHQRV